MKLNRKWILVMSLVLSLMVATGSTLAYMTQKTQTETNTFTLGNVDITLTEPNWDKNNAVLYPGDSVAKDPTITNTGKGPAWVWMEVEIPSAVFPYISLKTIDENKWNVVKEEATDVVTLTLMYKSELAANGTATPFTSVELAENADLGDLTEFDIKVTGYAIQDSFDNVEEAYNVYTNGSTADSLDDLMDTISNGQNAVANNTVYNVMISEEDITLDAKGATVTLQGTASSDTHHGYLGWVSDSVSVSNLNVTGSGFVELGDYTDQGGTNIANNLKIENLASTLSNNDRGFDLACGFVQYGTGTLNDCTMTGTTALVEGAMPVDLGCINNTTTDINNGKYGVIYCWSHSVVNLNGAEVDTLYAAPIKGTVTIKANTHVKTLKVDYGASSKYATKERLEKQLVIEEGASVDSIVYGDETYTVETWNAFVASLS